MLALLVIRELTSILLSPRFLILSTVTVGLVAGATWLGVEEYSHDREAYENAVELDREWLNMQPGWDMITWSSVYRAPAPFQVFVSGLTRDIGRKAQLNNTDVDRIVSPELAGEPVFALFRPMDVAFVIMYVISLLAIVLSFDTICGEKERGTLRLTLSNAVPRTQFVLAKFLSSWLALLLPVLLAFLVGAFLVTVSGIPFAPSDWLRLGVLFGLSTLFVTVFLAFGLLVSSSVHRPADSFMILLVLWVSAVLIVPKVATVASGEIADVPTVAEISSETQAVRREIDNQVRLRHVALVDSMYEAAKAHSRSNPGEFYDRNREAVEDAWRRFEKFREGKEVEFVAFSRRLGERVEAQKSQMARLALSLSRISPASSYQIAAARLAGTDLGMKQRFEDAVSEFSTINRKLADEKIAPSRNGSGQMEPFDVTQLPQFAQPKQMLSEVAADVILDVGLLALWALLGFAAAYVAFLRYDVR